MNPGKIKKLSVILVSSVIIILLMGSCGLEDYPYIYPVPQSNVTPEMNYRSVIRIPTNNMGSAFTHHVIFYRIYVSDMLESSTTSSTSYSGINSYLLSDYNSFLNYIDSDTLVNVNMDSLFQGRNYKYLYLEGANMEDVLSSSVLGRTVTFDFSSSKYPTITVDNTSTYTLLRSTGNGLFNPRPNRYFVNSQDLWNPDYITDTNINADVANKSSFSNDSRYTYAAMYIVAVGVDTSTYSEIYSTPSLIHVFLLPEQW